MKFFKIGFPFLIFILLCSACSNNKKKLTAHPWIVQKAIVDTKENLARDTVASKTIERAFKDRVYDFKDDGTFTITSGTKSLTGKWNLGKDDSNMLYHDMGAKQTMVIMRIADDPSQEEVWIPWTNDKTIFIDNEVYKDMIQTTVLPAFEEGNLYLTLIKKSE